MITSLPSFSFLSIRLQPQPPFSYSTYNPCVYNLLHMNTWEVGVGVRVDGWWSDDATEEPHFS